MTVKEMYKSPKISEMEDFSELKKYACAKVGHIKEWYLQCVDCPQQKKCAAGMQAVKLMESSTTPAKQDIPDPKTNLRGFIEWAFTQKDPVREVLQISTEIKPQSVYQRVRMWSKNFPDLEEKYHMLEKFRWLWSKPWETMRVTDILKEKYPEDMKDIRGAAHEDMKDTRGAAHESPKPEPVKPEPQVKVKPVFPRKPDISDPKTDFHGKYADIELVEPIGKPKSDEIPLEDLLAEIRSKRAVNAVNGSDRAAVNAESSSSREANPIMAEKEPAQSAPVISGKKITSDLNMGGGNIICETKAVEISTDLDGLLEKLRKSVAEYQQKIKEAEDKISAILTVQQMMKDGV